MVCGAAGSKERDSVTTDGGARQGAKTVFGEGAWHLAAWHLAASSCSMASGSENLVSRPVRMFDVSIFHDSLSTDASIFRHQKWRWRKRGGGEMGEKKRKVG